MRLYIAEKPSLGRAIADVLPKPHKKQEGYIQAANGDCVSWCIGHLLEQAEPDAYDPAFKSWKLEHLPIIPIQWQLQPKPKTRKQVTVLKKLIKQASQIIHAGDPDREGQLLVDELLDYVGLTQQQKSGVLRCLISDLNGPAVKRAINKLRPNAEFVPLSVSALARSRADWLYGINLTRAYTLQGRKVGYDGVVSVGRVQTPILGLIVRREQEIEQFQPKPFYEVLAHLHTEQGGFFKAKWQPSKACEPYQDEQGRVLHKGLAENVCQRITNKPAQVTKLEQKQRKQAPPLTHNLSALQIDAAKRYGMNAKQVLDICQALYEKHKVITYPRSDSRYLPVEHHRQASEVLAAVAKTAGLPAQQVNAADTKRKTSVWNDKKVDAHHAIIPTAKSSSSLSGQEQQVYDLIARQYLAQFYPDYRYHETKVEVTIEGGLFTTKAIMPLDQGWKVLFKSAKGSQASSDSNKADDETQTELPPLEQGQSLHCSQGELLEKMTQPPPYFTDASLLSALTGIARFVTDKAIKKILKETDGLGTEATRAGIIDLLFKRGFLTRQGKQIRATDAGKGLITSLPELATTPDMTAHWESTLDGICQKQASYQQFMGDMEQKLGGLLDYAKRELPVGLQGVKAVKKQPFKRRKKSWGKKKAS